MTTDEFLEHHGIKGQKWGVRRYQKKDGSLTPAGKERYGMGAKSRSVRYAQSKADLIKAEVDKYEKGGPAGNQNCQLCTWSMEAQFRGKNVLPRPVYSPRDIIFEKNGYDIVKNPVRESISNKDDVVKKVKDAGNGSRFYTHVNWKDSQGGHEFIVVNIDSEVYVIDAQVGLVAPIKSKETKMYFNDINYSNSFLVRMDDKEFNEDTLKYNDQRYLVEWDDDKDVKYLIDHNMIHSYSAVPDSQEIMHHGIKGQKWGVRRYQNLDGTLTPAGRKRKAKQYQDLLNEQDKEATRQIGRVMKTTAAAERAAARGNQKRAEEKAKEALEATKLWQEIDSQTWKTFADAVSEGYDVTAKRVYRNTEMGRSFVTTALTGPIGNAAINLYRQSKFYKEYGEQAPWAVAGQQYRVRDVSRPEEERDRS